MAKTATKVIILESCGWKDDLTNFKCMLNSDHKKLLALLDEAVNLSSQFTGGYSGPFFSAEEFHTALAESVARFKLGDNNELGNLYHWFAPTYCWDDFIGGDGLELANEIFALLSEMLPTK